MKQPNRLVIPNYALFNPDEIPIPEGKKKIEVSVPSVKGLKCMVSSQSITFMNRWVHDGRKESKVIGKYPDMSVETAVGITLHNQSLLARGISPLVEIKKREEMPSLVDFFTKIYLPHAKQNKKSWKDDKSRFDNHIQSSIGDFKLNQITSAMISDVLMQVKESGCKNATVNRIRALLSSILNMAFERELIDQNPIVRVKKFVEQNQVERYLGDGELKNVMKVLTNPEQYGIENLVIVAIIEMLLLTGARKSEVLNLRWIDLDLANNLWKLSENKSGKPRVIQLNSEAQGIIRKMSRKYEYVFANPATNKPYNDIRKTFQKVLDAADIHNFRIHDLRHNFASMAVNNGCDIYVVQHLLGHASPTTTQRYAHLRQDTILNASKVIGGRIHDARPDNSI